MNMHMAFEIMFHKPYLSGRLSVSNGVDPDHDVLSVLIWVQTVCKGYKQMTKVALARKEIQCQNI